MSGMQLRFKYKAGQNFVQTAFSHQPNAKKGLRWNTALSSKKHQDLNSGSPPTGAIGAARAGSTGGHKTHKTCSVLYYPAATFDINTLQIDTFCYTHALFSSTPFEQKHPKNHHRQQQQQQQQTQQHHHHQHHRPMIAILPLHRRLDAAGTYESLRKTTNIPRFPKDASVPRFAYLRCKGTKVSQRCQHAAC